MERKIRPLSRRRIILARALAVTVDFFQIVVSPVFSLGAASPLDDVLDVATAAGMIGLVGWHWAFLPSFLSELVPVWDLAPTWTIAVFLATRKGATGVSGQPVPPRPGTIETTLAGKDIKSKEVS